MSRPKVLLIEDDDTTRRQLEWALRDEFTLLAAGDSATALTLAREESPTAILLDLGLPRIRAIRISVFDFSGRFGSTALTAK